MTQAPCRVLRNVYRGGDDTGVKTYASENGIGGLLRYHLCTSADLHGDVAPGVAHPNHQDPLPPVGVGIFVFPAVNASPWEFLVSWRERERGGARIRARPSLGSGEAFPRRSRGRGEGPRTWEVLQGHGRVDELTRAHQNRVEHVLLLLAVAARRHHVPLSGAREPRPRGDPHHRRLEQRSAFIGTPLSEGSRGRRLTWKRM